MTINNIKVALFLAFTCFTLQISAQLATAPEPTLESPYNTIYVHLFFLQSDSYEPEIAAQTIVPILDSAAAVEIAIQIKQIYDGKGLYVRLNNLPQEEAYLDSITEKPYYTPFPKKAPEIYLERIDGKWYYSRETVSLVPELHHDLYPLGSDFLVRLLPRKANAKFLGLFAWQHLGFALIALLCFIVYFILSRVITRILRSAVKKRENWHFVGLNQSRSLARYIGVFVSIWVARMMLPAIQLPVRGSDFANRSLDILLTIIFMMAGMTLINIFTNRAKALTEDTESKMDDQLLPIVSRMGKILIVIISLFVILDLLNVNVTALIAGISIGGLALALAAKDTVENLFGSAMIFIDRPFQVGDYIIAGSHEGTVMEVGFRSTRIMKIDTSIVSIPNGAVAHMPLTNLGVRLSRLFNITIGVTYETPPDLIEAYIQRLKQLILDHPETNNDPLYVHLAGLADSSITIMFRCQIQVASYAEDVQAREELLFSIIRVAEEMGVEFAYPTTMVHMAKTD